MPILDRRSVLRGCVTSAAAALMPAVSRADAVKDAVKRVAFADGGTAPALGLGSWHIASPGAAPEADAVEALRTGLSLGLDLIDTAELYSGGRGEEVVGKAIAGRRDKVFLVSKVMPEHATEDGIERALRASLARLGTDHLDLYLLHWRKRRRERLLDTLLMRDSDLKIAVRGFERARAQGLIKRWGVSNFGVADMEDLLAVPGGKAALLGSTVLKQIGTAHGASPATVALAWAMRDGRTMVVTETSSVKHVREDAAALALTLSERDLRALDEVFPPPKAS